MKIFTKPEQFKDELFLLRKKYYNKLRKYIVKELGIKPSSKKNPFEGREEQEFLLYSFINPKSGDLAGILPTNAGKSLIFRVGSAYVKMNEGKPSIVISPLISLMMDQGTQGFKDEEKALKKYLKDGIIIFNSRIVEDHQEYYKKAKKKFKSGEFSLAYVSPERFRQKWFLDSYKHIKLGRFIIDEMHCVTSWGEKFRYEYKNLAYVLQFHPEAKLVLLTASAHDNRIRRTLELLISERKRLNKSIVVKKDIIRDNIVIEKAVFCPEKDEEKKRANYSLPFIKRIFKQNKKSKVLVFTMFAKNPMMQSNWNADKLCDYYSKRANKLGIKASQVGCYHAQMDLSIRSEMQAKFKSGKIRLLVCTKAFGMEVNIPNIRGVVHVYPPVSPEDYYQEIGRGGRDATPEDPCYSQMICSKKDRYILRNFLRASWDLRIFQAWNILSNGVILIDKSDPKLTKEFQMRLDYWRQNGLVSYNGKKIKYGYELYSYACKSKKAALKMYNDVINPQDGIKKPTAFTRKTARWIYLYATMGNIGWFKVPPAQGIKLLSSHPEIESVKKLLSEMEDQWWIIRDEYDEGNHSVGWYSGYRLTQSTLSLKESREYIRKIERMVEEIEKNWDYMEKICMSNGPWKLLGKILN